MNVPTVIAIIGGVLFLVGLIGGGIEIREAKMPKLSLGVRIFSMALGLGFNVISTQVRETCRMAGATTLHRSNAHANVDLTVLGLDDMTWTVVER